MPGTVPGISSSGSRSRISSRLPSGSRTQARRAPVIALVAEGERAIEAFRAGAREDLAEHEEAEVRLIDEFLPASLDEAALMVLIDEVVGETGATSAKDMGKVMSLVMERGGALVDGREASRLVRERLGG